MCSQKVMIELLSGIWHHFSDMKSFVWALRILTLTNTLALKWYSFFYLAALPVSILRSKEHMDSMKPQVM